MSAPARATSHAQSRTSLYNGVGRGYRAAMRVVFVALAQEQLGLSMLSAVLRRAGHETALAFNPALFGDRYYFDVPLLRDFFDRTERMIEEAVQLEPDLLAFSVLTPTYTWCLEVARRVKERTGCAVIFGGVHPSAAPEVCLENDYVDYVCVGEGEHAIVELCEQLDRGRHRPVKPIPNIWWKDERGDVVSGPNAAFNQDLDKLPYWDKELWEDVIDVGAHYLTMSSRGCPYRCTFCFNNFFARLPGKGGGKYVRQRSVENQMNELRQMHERYRLRYIEFADDIFTVNKDWIREFTNAYKKEIGVPFQCLIHPRFIDREMARWLADAGCVHVQMGVQSVDEEYRRKTLLRNEKDDHLRQALEALRDAGLEAKLDHILGLPGEPLGAQEEARKLYAEFTPRRIQTFWLTYVPGIDMTKQALADGILTPQDVHEIERGRTRAFRHQHLDARSKDQGAQQFYQRYDLLFRAMPLLPASVRRRIRAEHLPALGEKTANAVGFAFDLANVIRSLDTETLTFIEHYARQIMRQTPELIPGKQPAVTRPKVRAPIHDG
ncbi:MAG TPA: radical SAM protein, partial [Polyangium sp.]|nr:radical SAM protein [Polyangium sp.]